jgi:hypothetical protein
MAAGWRWTNADWYNLEAAVEAGRQDDARVLWRKARASGTMNAMTALHPFDCVVPAFAVACCSGDWEVLKNAIEEHGGDLSAHYQTDDTTMTEPLTMVLGWDRRAFALRVVREFGATVDWGNTQSRSHNFSYLVGQAPSGRTRYVRLSGHVCKEFAAGGRREVLTAVASAAGRDRVAADLPLLLRLLLWNLRGVNRHSVVADLLAAVDAAHPGVAAAAWGLVVARPGPVYAAVFHVHQNLIGPQPQPRDMSLFTSDARLLRRLCAAGVVRGARLWTPAPEQAIAASLAAEVAGLAAATDAEYAGGPPFDHAVAPTPDDVRRACLAAIGNEEVDEEVHDEIDRSGRCSALRLGAVDAVDAHALVTASGRRPCAALTLRHRIVVRAAWTICRAWIAYRYRPSGAVAQGAWSRFEAQDGSGAQEAIAHQRDGSL